MSYARFSEGDVYVFRGKEAHGSKKDRYICMACKMTPDNATKLKTYDGKIFEWHGDFVCQHPNGMLGHLRAHQEAGHLVPRRAILRLKQEMSRVRRP